MNTLATITNPYVLLGQPSGGQQKDLVAERRTTNNDENTENQDDHQLSTTEYVLRGELLDSIVNDKRYQAQYSENVDPKNRHAISQYQSIDIFATESGSSGRLIDSYT